MPKADKEKLANRLDALRIGDLVEIKFLDASESKNVKEERITNKVYATYKRVIGEVHGLKLDMVYGQPYLILITARTDSLVDIVSIPFSTVVNVHWLTPVSQATLKRISAVGTPYLAGGVRSKYKVKEFGVGELDETTKTNEE